MKVKYIALAVLTALSISFSQAKLPEATRIGKELGGWRAEAAIGISNGYLVVGSQTDSINGSCMAIAGTDSMGNNLWTRSYRQLTGHAAALGALPIEKNQVMVAGTQNGRAKLWHIDAHTGNITRTRDLGPGRARAIVGTSRNRFAISIESLGDVAVLFFDGNSKDIWKRNFHSGKRVKSSLLALKNGNLAFTFGENYKILTATGQPVLESRLDQTQWQGIYHRNNMEVLFFGNQTTKIFDADNPDAFVASVPCGGLSKAWFRQYGETGSYDTASDMAESPDGRLLLLTQQGQRIRLLELAENHTVSKSTWLTDSTSNYDCMPVKILNQSAWQDKWLILYNRSDGTVWFQQTKASVPPVAATTDLGFTIAFADAALRPFVPQPISEVPVTYALAKPRPRDTYIYFKDFNGEGYAYLLGRKEADGEWIDQGWVKIGSRIPLVLDSKMPFDRCMILVSNRPYAAPLALITQMNKVYGLRNQRNTEPRPEVDVSVDGTRFAIRNFPVNGWTPILFNIQKTNSPLFRW